MGIEIERKFLVTNDGWRAAAHAVIPMAQGYINDMAAMDSGAQKASVRVRIQGDEAYLNIKSR
ncbi:MAG TPA: CYTH domain-containing protein, partial [Stenotrophomonas sp.]